jgi:spore germination protein
MVLMLAASVHWTALNTYAMGKKPAELPRPQWSSWVVYWDDRYPAEALHQYGSTMDEVCLFAYHFDQNGRIIPAGERVHHLSEAFRRMTFSRRPRWLVTIVNDVITPQGNRLKDPGVVHEAIATAKARGVHIQQLLELASGFDGIEIDYERTRPEDSPAFSQLIEQLSSDLHQQHKWLSVVVQPRTDDSETPDMLRTGSATIDWETVASFADEVKVMAYLYRYSGSEPGSIAPMDWVERIASYSLRVIPQEKLCIVLHVGGFDWPKGSPGLSIEFDEVQALAARDGRPLEHDKDSESAYFSYHTSTTTHVVWVEDGQGLLNKVDRLRRLGITRIGFWRLNSGDPRLWDILVSPAAQR